MEKMNNKTKTAAYDLVDTVDKAAKLVLQIDTEDEDGEVLGARVRYADCTALDSVLIMNSVLMNRAICDGYIRTEDEAEKAGTIIRDAVKKAYNFDTVQTARQLYEKKGGDADGKKRYVWNLELLTRLKEVLEKNPDMRFEQALWNLNLTGDHFYEEPWDTAARIESDFIEMSK